jgi:hypothetical protein
MRIADTPPAFCAGCYGQYPDRRHVDFEAAWDGPVFEGEGVHTGDGGARSKLPVGIDDLVICEDCLKSAAKLLGWAGPKAQQKIDDLELRLARSEGYARELNDENEKFREILSTQTRDGLPPKLAEEEEVPAA